MPLYPARNLNLYNVKDFGLVGNGVADDTAAFNAALLQAHTNGGGEVLVPYCTPLISAPLVIYSNTKLTLAAGTVITLAPSSNCNMIKNAATSAVRSVTDAAMSVNQSTLLSATAAFTGADVGRTVLVSNALDSTNHYALTARIVLVNTGVLALYGTSVVDATLATASAMTANTAVNTNEVSTTSVGPVGSFTYQEVYSAGTNSATGYASAIPATPTGNGWVYYPGAGTFSAGNWSASITLSNSNGPAAGSSYTLRFSKLSGGVYTTIGTIVSNWISSTKQAYTFAPTAMSSATFAAGDALYIDLFWHDPSNVHSDNPAVYLSSAATGSIANDMQITTSSFNGTSAATLSQPAQSTVSAQNCSIYNRDSAIEISGGIWQRGSNGYPGGVTAGAQYQTTLFRHIDGISVHDATFACNQKGYQLSIGDATNVTVKTITLNTANTVVNTDGVSIAGPAQYVLVDGVYGVNGDDFVSSHGIDSVLSASNGDVAGPVTDMIIQNLYPNGNGGGSCAIASRLNAPMTSITVRGVHGSSNYGVAIWGGPANTPLLVVDDILVEDVDVTLTNTNSIVQMETLAPVGTITLRNIAWRQTLGTNVHIIDFQNNSTLGTLIVDGLEINGSASPFGVAISGALNTLIMRNITKPDSTNSMSSMLIVNSNGAVDTVIMDGITAYVSTGAQNDIFAANGAVKNLIMSNMYINGGVYLFDYWNTSQALTIFLNNVTCDGIYKTGWVETNATVRLFATNLNVLSQNQTDGIIKVTGSGASLTILGKGLYNPNNYPAFSRDATQKPRINHPEMLADLSQLTPNDQDMVNNSNAGLSCGAGLCIYHTGGTGNGWKNIYSGSTY